jgi:hypothetical protein
MTGGRHPARRDGAVPPAGDANLVHQWRRGRGYKENRPATAEGASGSSPQFGRNIKASARKPRQAVITRYGDGRHTVGGASGCARSRRSAGAFQR